MIPKEHFRTLAEMPAKAFAETVGAKLAKIADAVVAATGSEGFNVFIANEACAGQVVFHLHVHIVPRRQGDGLRPAWRQGQYTEGEMAALAEKIAAAIV